ncbi:hypothetical protein [Pseudomonas sp. AM14(2022)]|uniref:hypothetical protein n=1 Tax=Pseudomonas sp. AM14(2022) TaxID=2983371 RepID=UPI002E81919D|nr:hypothetical protein [Pseudomonas sp. AM14(2022)]
MNDSRDLKAIAEACQQHQPLRFMRSHGALYIRNDNGIVFDVHQNRSFPEFMAQNKDYADLVLAANPAAVLALIAENECLRADLREVKDAKLGLSWAIGEVMGECDRFKVENEALRKDADRLQSATAFVQKLCDSAGKQPSVATGYLHDILSALGKGEQS